MRYKIYYKGDAVQAISKNDKCIPMFEKDIIIYTVDANTGIIYAKIANPSQHTMHLISQGRCFLGLNKKMTHEWCFYGSPAYGRQTIRRLGQRERHPYWTKSSTFTKVVDVNNITIYFPTGEYSYKSVDYLNRVSDFFKDPLRETYYVTFKPILVSGVPSGGGSEIYNHDPNVRVYSTKSVETTLTINRE